LTANVRLGWKWLRGDNTLAYYGLELIPDVKYFCRLTRRRCCRFGRPRWGSPRSTCDQCY